MATTRVLLVLALLALAACGESQDLSNAPLAKQIDAATSSVSLTETWYSSPLETTPLTRYVINGEQKSRSVSDLFVVGTVTAVAGGQGYSWPDGPQVSGGEETEKVHDFNADAAWMSTVHLTVSIESSLYKGNSYSDLKEVVVGLALLSPVDLKALQEELVGQKIAAPLQSNEKTFFRKEPGVYGVLLSGELLGFVENEKVTFPALDKLPASPDGTNTVNLSDLLNPPTTVTLRKENGQFVKAN